MTPYYEDGAVTIYNSDCRDVSWVGDVLVTDPPYGTRTYEHDVQVFDHTMLRGFQNAAVFGWPERLVALCIDAERVPQDWIVWWPTNSELRRGSPKGHTPRESEHIAVFGQVRWVRGASRGGILSAVYQGANSRGNVHVSPEGKKWGDVWTDPSPGLGFQSDLRLHPNEKPLGIMRRLLQVVAEGDVIDPFMGSGSTLVAAKSLGRKAIGIEIDERFCEVAATRCRQEVLGLASVGEPQR